MTNCIATKNLTKHYQTFSLKPITLNLPVGGKLVLIGNEGSGKSTFLRCILGLTKADSGEITRFQEETLPTFLDQTGVVLGTSSLPSHLSPKQVQRIFAPQYSHWNQTLFEHLIETLELSFHQALGSKLHGRECLFACALAHNPSFLVVDRPCFHELHGENQEEQSIQQQNQEDCLWRESEQKCLALLPGCFSGKTEVHTRHSVEDLPPSVTHLGFFRDGELLLYGKRLDLLEQCATVTCSVEDLQSIDTTDYIRGIPEEEGYCLLIRDRFEFFLKYPRLKMEDITIAKLSQIVLDGEKFPQSHRNSSS